MIKALILGISYFTFYYLLGFAVVKLSNGNEKKDSIILSGFFCYAVLFFMIGFPLKLLKITITRIGITWIAFISICAVLILWKWHSDIKLDFIYRIQAIWKHKWISFGIFLIVLLEMSYIEFQGVPGSSLDASYNIGEISSGVFDNVAGITDPHSGAELNSFSMTYVMETYLLHSSVMCRIFQVAPLVEVRTIMAGIAVILYNVVLFHIGNCLFPKNYQKIFGLYLVAYIICMFSTSIYVPGSFFMNRAFEGKSFLANIFIPSVFMYFLKLAEKETLHVWLGMFLAICASYTYSMSALFILPVLLLGLFSSLIIYRKSWHTMFHIFICMVPCIIVFIFYYCVRKGYI